MPTDVATEPATLPSEGEFILPILGEGLLAVEPVALLAKELPLISNAAARNISAAKSPEKSSVRAQALPTNLGHLGEEYACRYLSCQPWIQPDSVKHLTSEGNDYACACVPLAEPGRSTVEVKTRWDGCRVKLSARQLSRLLDPSDDYMLLVVGDASRLFESPPSPPQVRIVHSPPRPADAASKSERGASRRAPPASARGVADQAEDLIDRLLDGGATKGLPTHIVEYLRQVGLTQLRRQWPPNRKASAKLMRTEAERSVQRAPETSPRDRPSGGLAVQLAIEELLRLAALVAADAKPRAAASSQQGGGRHMELCLASCACLDSGCADDDDLVCARC